MQISLNLQVKKKLFLSENSQENITMYQKHNQAEQNLPKTKETKVPMITLGLAYRPLEKFSEISRKKKKN